jgi:carboxylesterase
MSKPNVYQHPELDGSSFYFDQGRAAVLCLHGFTATTTEVRPVAEYLNSQGYAAAGPLLPGHGTTPEDLNDKTYLDWIDSVESYLDIISKNHEHIFVLGESMGALLALHLLAIHPALHGGIILAPALHIPRLWQSKIVSPFIRIMPKGGDGDEEMPWKGYNVLPIKAAASLFDFQKIVRDELSSIHQPIIVFQGKLDKRIDPVSSEIILEKVSSSDKELVIMQESGHVILLDKQSQDVNELCKDFIERVLAENQGG